MAYPGDVVGLVNATGLQLGDTIHDRATRSTFPPIPRFSPEVFATARPLDTGRAKQFRKGLEQLDEEGVVQVLRDPDHGETAPILAAVGALQFEVFGHRLASEFGAPAEILSRRLPGDPPHRQGSRSPRLRDIGGIRILRRSDGELVALFENRYRLARLEQDEPELTLEPLVAGAVPAPLTRRGDQRHPARRYPESMLPHAWSSWDLSSPVAVAPIAAGAASAASRDATPARLRWRGVRARRTSEAFECATLPFRSTTPTPPARRSISR